MRTTFTILFAWALGAAGAYAGAMPAKTAVELPTGVTVRYFEMGQPKGEAVVFLHGFTDTSRSFLPTMRRLTTMRPELRLIALDLRGHGESTMPAAGECAAVPERCFGMGDFAGDVVALMDALGIARADLVGHSMGTFVAREIAATRPERVRRMALVATTPTPAGHPAVAGFLRDGLVEGPWREALVARGLRFPDDAYALTPLDVGADVGGWLAANWVTEPAADAGFLAAVLPETTSIPLGTWIGGIRGMLLHRGEDDLRDLTVPTLVLAAAGDELFPRDPDQLRVLALIDDATDRHGVYHGFRLYGGQGAPGVYGHNFHWAVPDAVAADLATFLRAAPYGGGAAAGALF